MIDTKALRKAQGYDRLPESYVIFITRKDIFRKGQAIYEIDRYIKGSWEPYGDGTHIIHVCAAVHDLLCTDPEDIYYNELREKVSYYKNDEEGIIEMTTEFNKMLKESDQRGERRGRREGRRETAINMIADGSRGCQEFCVNGILNHSFTLSPKTMENWLRASPQLRIG